METTRQTIERLAEEYLKDENYTHGWASSEWVEKVSVALNLEKLSDLELSNMWDMVYLVLENSCHYYDRNGNSSMGYKYLDVQSAFTEIVNIEARKRKTNDVRGSHTL